MQKFGGKILLFGFGAIGKSFFELYSKEIDINAANVFVVDKTNKDIKFFYKCGGIKGNFIKCNVTQKNFKRIFGKIISCGDLFVDLSSETGAIDIITWCALNNIMYVNTSDNDWRSGDMAQSSDFEYLSVIQSKIEDFNKDPNVNRCPIVLQFGADPGLSSVFMKMALRYIANEQFADNDRYKKLIRENKYNLLAKELGVKEVHISDNDIQQVNIPYNPKILYNTWCPFNFYLETSMQSQYIDAKQGLVTLPQCGALTECVSYDPNNSFVGHIVQHEDTFSIARYLEVYEKSTLVYRPTVKFVYKPCDIADRYLKEHLPQKTGKTKVLYDEIVGGTEYVGVYITGDKFKPVWVGNRVELSYIANHNYSNWQTPTITPVAAAALSACCWILKNPNKKGVFYPEDIDGFDEIIKTAEQYISATIFKTFKE
jgi:homospermidine synthase